MDNIIIIATIIYYLCLHARLYSAVLPREYGSYNVIVFIASGRYIVWTYHWRIGARRAIH